MLSTAVKSPLIRIKITIKKKETSMPAAGYWL